MDNTDSMKNIMNLVKLFAPSSTPSKASSQDNSWPMFPLDAQIHTEPLRVCKCLIPYLPLEKQRDISILIKVFELAAVAEHFSNLDDTDSNLTRSDSSEPWQKDLLASVRNNLDPKNAYWVDILFKIHDVKEILATAQSSEDDKPLEIEEDSSKPSKEFTENISPHLNDNQKQILEMLSTVMK